MLLHSRESVEEIYHPEAKMSTLQSMHFAAVQGPVMSTEEGIIHEENFEETRLESRGHRLPDGNLDSVRESGLGDGNGHEEDVNVLVIEPRDNSTLESSYSESHK